MQSNEFIDRLVGDLQPVRRQSFGRDALVLAALCIAELVVFFSLGQMRPDMGTAMDTAALWWKFGSMGIITAIGGTVAVMSFDPARSARSGLRWILMSIAACLAAGWFIDALHQGWPALLARVDWRNGVQCAYEMAILSVPMLAGLAVLMRRGAPTDLAATALSAGVGAAAWGAFVFVFACPYDDPLYIAVWYSVGCGLVTAVSRFILPRLTRW